MACPYKDIFGAPGTGAHSYRLGNVAIVDVALTALVGYLIAVWRGWNPIVVIVLLFISSVFVHKLFCVDTTWTRFVFG
jgi:uncharacterized membrane protein